MTALFPKQDSIRNFLLNSNLKSLLLAVSGGLDSICLAHYFITNKKALGIKWLGIAHVHHGLREGTADRDAEFVQNFATQSSVPFFLKRLDGNLLKASEGSLEENARKARYGALLEIADEIAKSPAIPVRRGQAPGMTSEDKLGMTSEKIAIVTAHHAGDQAETLYMRLRRGTTLAGLHGIQEIRTLSFAAPLSSLVSRHSSLLYRPFLNVTREQLREYAFANNLSWCEDESNADTKFARNKIRHEALPELEKIYPGAAEQLSRIATLADSAHAKIVADAERIFAPAIVPPEKWPFEASLSPYKKVLALDESTLKTTFDKLAEATKSDTQKQGMQEIFRLWLDSRGFRFPTGAFSINVTKSSINKPQRGPDECQEPRPHTSYLIPSFSFRTRSIETCRHIIWIYDTREIQVSSNLYFSNEKQRFSGVPGLWRHPQESDVLSPMDMKIKARKLATWLQEKSIPHWIRDFLQVYAQDSKVLFVSGIRNKKFDT